MLPRQADFAIALTGKPYCGLEGEGLQSIKVAQPAGTAASAGDRCREVYLERAWFNIVRRV
jgi:hypothetical protein